MAVVKYSELESHLRHLTQRPSFRYYPAYLLYGEELLVKRSFQTIVATLIPDADPQHGYEAWDGSPENIVAALRQLNTYALLGDGKVVAVLDTPIFYQSQKQAGASTRRRQPEPNMKNVAAALTGALSDGFPQGHYLILTTDAVDKRRRLYKTLEANGLVVDCSVPKGDRKADKVAQDAVLRDITQAVLSASGKSMDAAALAAVSEMTGFDLRTFRNNLNKLVDYVGERRRIQADDVSTVLKRSRQDPIYAFTNSLGRRSPGDALFYMDSLLSAGYHELQLTSAAVNVMRRLLVIKAFADEQVRDVDLADMSFTVFRDRVMPLVQAHDDDLKAQLAVWEQGLSNSEGSQADASKRGVRSDLFMAPNPKNAYPVFKLFQKAVFFSKRELLLALKTLGHTDRLLKSSGRSSRSILADAVVKICRKADRR